MGESGDTVTVDPALDTGERAVAAMAAAAGEDDPFRTVAPNDPAAKPTRGDTVRRKRPPTFGPDGSPTHDTTPGGGRGTRTLDAGTILGGCRLDKLLGQGGMATVYQGEQLDLGRAVAVKVLKHERTRDQEFVKGFVREAKTLARLDHPNIVTIHNVGQEAGQHFLVMQLVTGGTLLDKIQKKGRFSPEEAVRSIRLVASGLQAAHKKGIIHRDVKPGNVLITGDGVPKISDFGIARTGVTGETLGVGLVLGTAHYMPPEQVDAAPIDARSDIYALGASFYHLLTGQPPFKGSSVIELMLKQVSEPLIPPHERDSTVPVPISRVVCRMMAKRPADRYQTMEEVIEALDHPEREPAPAVTTTDATGKRRVVEAPGGGATTVDVTAPWVPPPTTQTPTHPIKRPLPPRPAPTPPAEPTPAPEPAASAQVARPPRQPGAAGAGLRVAVLSAAILGAAAFLLAGMAPSGEQTDVSQAKAELEADLAWGRLEEETAASPPAERLARLQAFAAERLGTARAIEAGRIAQEMERTTAGRTADALVQAKKLRAEGSLGPAIAALAGLASTGDVAALSSELRLELEKSGMAWIPPGSFVSGWGSTLLDRKLEGFYIDRREVTRAEYHVHAKNVGARVPWSEGAPDAATGGLPVTGISLAEAEAFALASGKRLPSAWEWERAARGESGQAWPWGPEPDPQAFNWNGGELRPAGSFPLDLSPHGCFDMAGNAAEMTLANQREVWIRGGSIATRQLEGARPAFWVVARPGAEQHPAIGFRCAADRVPPGAGER